MNSFLYRIAQTYYTHQKESISNFTFVFPNRRAGLFFQKYLSQIAEKPIFSPEIITINDCFSMASSLQPADRLGNLFKLFRIYIQQSGSEETFDAFVFWGEMLMSDFEEVDKYLVDVKQLFTNITELKQIDQLFNIFSDKQVEAIRQFWSSFIPVSEGKTQEDFVTTWKILFSVYQTFRAELISENVGTEGMICREIAEKLKAKHEIEEYSAKQFVFVGFNALNPCEKTLMVELQKRGQADFYWDYEASESRDENNQASLFYAQNTHSFPSKYDVEPVFESLSEKKIELIAVPSAVGQTKQIFSILQQLFPKNDAISDSELCEPIPATNWMDTAVVLPDESLLIPLLHSIPSQIEKINVTMGFPLKSSPVSGLIEHIFELQHRKRTSGNKVSFYHQTVSNILNHQYILLLCEKDIQQIAHEMANNNWIYIDASDLNKNDLLASIFMPQTNSELFIQYLLTILKTLQLAWQKAADDTRNYRLENDFLYQYIITINRIADVISSHPQNSDIALDTLMRLLRQLTAGMTIPFEGEPLDGLQVMGVLEIRGLDFENLIITSFNEGIFPQKTSTNSFIPYNLRKGFGLPTAEHQDAITAYNFYRLLHHSKNIYFLYDSRTDGSQTGEVSRFMHQLYFHYGIKANVKNISFNIGSNNISSIQIDKTSNILHKLHRFTSADDQGISLSASSINMYIDCPLQFYLTKVESIEEIEEVLEKVESNMFGTIFHAVMENIYRPYKGKIISSEEFDVLIKNTLNIDKEISRAFSAKYFKKKNDTIVPLEGNNLLIANVLRKYIDRVLKVDKTRAPFRYVNSEEPCKIQFPINGANRWVNLKGFIDRVDEKEGQLRILDYKTGAGKLDFPNLDQVFEHNNKSRAKFVLQTFLYCYLYEEKYKKKNTIPGIYYIRNIFKEDFKTELCHKDLNVDVMDFAEYKDEFLELLTICLEDIFDPEIPFIQTENLDICKYCAYKSICNK